jgi:hypothetical protein
LHTIYHIVYQSQFVVTQKIEILATVVIGLILNTQHTTHNTQCYSRVLVLASIMQSLLAMDRSQSY